jgi:hypothetical protein
VLDGVANDRMADSSVAAWLRVKLLEACCNNIEFTRRKRTGSRNS